MAKLQDINVKHIAKLAKLKLTDREIDKFKKQLGQVIDYIRQLSEADTKTSQAVSQTTGLENIFRADKKMNQCLSSNEALSGTEKVKNDYFVVPGIFETREE